jgi:uncharacterized membrane protein
MAGFLSKFPPKSIGGVGYLDSFSFPDSRAKNPSWFYQYGECTIRYSPKFVFYLLLILVLLMASIPSQFDVRAQTPEQPVVQAVLFWIEGCPHCHEVLDIILPALQEQFGNKLKVTSIDLSGIDEINSLYEVAARFGVPKEHVGVPLLLVGEQILIGSEKIKAELPGLIETYLARGGISLPNIPEFSIRLTDNQTEEVEKLAASVSKPVPESESPVEGIMFTTPDCHDCQLIVSQVLKIASQDYPGQFRVETVNIITSADVDYLHQVTAQYGLTVDETDLPLLILGNEILVNEEIPALLPALLEKYLRTGEASNTPLPTPAGRSNETSTPAETSPAFQQGYWIAIGTLIFMAAALLYTLTLLALAANRHLPPRSFPTWRTWGIPILALIGLGVASYLAYVETQRVEAVCGPVGDCNAVQRSAYARVFGILPVGLLGVVGYLAILSAWVWGRFRRDAMARYASLAVFGMSLLGTLFSFYLTCLEPFVIKAVCMWCISSALVITLVMLISLNPTIAIISEKIDARA